MRTKLISTFIALASLAGLTVPEGARADGFLVLVGAIHEHSGYSDGWPGSTPTNYFESGRSYGLDFLFGGEHSDNGPIPVAFSSYCTDDPTYATACTTEDPDKVSQINKWQAHLDKAIAATTPTFTAARGFEWTSDTFGHINVYFSTNEENAKTDGGYGATMETFYNWFDTPVALRGGADGIATFNHPGDKCNANAIDTSLCNWNDFAYVADADERMVGIEMFNTRKDFDRYYWRALDKGWHVGAVGAEDLGHKKTDNWGGPEWAKTVILSSGRSMADLKAAMLARRMYAVRTTEVRLEFAVNGEIMGSRISAAPGDDVRIAGSSNVPGASLDVVTSGGLVVATGGGAIDAVVPASGAQRYYYLRVRDASGRNVGYSSPVWVSA